jgi:hypothetical protein
MWHLTDDMLSRAKVWWCGDDELAGYDDHWLQFMQDSGA